MIDAEELATIFQDFTSGFAERIAGTRPAPIQRPQVIEGLIAVPDWPSGTFSRLGRFDLAPPFGRMPTMKTLFPKLGRGRCPGRSPCSPLPAQAAGTKANCCATPTAPSTHLKHDPAFGTARTHAAECPRRLHRAQAGQGRLHLRRRRRRRRAAAPHRPWLERARNSTAWARPRSACRPAWNRRNWSSSSTATRALAGIEHGNFKLGAGAGLTVVNLSSGAEGATTAHGGDIVVWTSGSGAYAGLTFNGSVISPDKDMNATPATGPEAEALRAQSGRRCV